MPTHGAPLESQSEKGVPSRSDCNPSATSGGTAGKPGRPLDGLEGGSAEREPTERDWHREVQASAWGLMSRLWGITPGRPGRCRKKRTSRSVQVQTADDGRVVLQGVETCGSVWCCPVCSAAVSAQRARQVQGLVEAWGRSRSVMVTATVRHDRGDRLAKEITGVARSWQRLWQGRAVAEAKERWGIGPWVRALEVTHGKNGWHAHLHAILCLHRELGSEVEDLRAAWSTRWCNAVVNELGNAAMPDPVYGVTVEPVHSASYLAKLGLELSGARKEARSRGGKHPYDLAHAAADGDPLATMLWREYVGATRGRRQLTWSRTAQSLRGTDAELVASEGSGAIVLEFSPDEWKQLTSQRCGIAAMMRTIRDSVAA